MTLQAHHIGVEGDCCRCGRRASLRHCPSCGSFQVKPRPSATTIVVDPDNPNGPRKVIERFICTRCRMIFDDGARKYCEALKYETKLDKAVAEIKRAQDERSAGHPLTGREEVIINASNETLPKPKVVFESRQKWTRDQERKLVSDWAAHNVTHPNDKKTLSEFEREWVPPAPVEQTQTTE